MALTKLAPPLVDRFALHGENRSYSVSVSRHNIGIIEDLAKPEAELASFVSFREALHLYNYEGISLPPSALSWEGRVARVRRAMMVETQTTPSPRRGKYIVGEPSLTLLRPRS